LYKDIPATGGLFGLERIIEIMKDRNMIKTKGAAAKVLVTIFSPKLLNNSIKIVNELRAKNVNSELYLDPSVRLDKQLKYADRKGIPFAVIAGPEEVAKGGFLCKNLATKEQKFYNMKQWDMFLQNMQENAQN
jgi:histidyl-tRNA synthetase